MTLARSLNQFIDHTLLKPEATPQQFEKLLDEAIEFKFEAVCVSPYMALPIKSVLNATGYPFIKVCTVVDFPFGNKPLELKVEEARFFVERGIDEIDFVLNYGELKNKNFKYVIKELQALSNVCKLNGAISKCIVETCYLDQKEKEAIFHFAKDYAPNLDFVKTSTGSPGTFGVKIEDIALWNRIRGNQPRPLIKASGGIKTLSQAVALIEAGADRLGMSTGVKVMKELHEQGVSTFTHREGKVEETS